MKKYLIILGVFLIIIAGIWFYSAQSKQSVSDARQTFNDKGFQVSEKGKLVSEEYITDTSALDLGIAIYPNSKLDTAKGAAGNLNFNGTKVAAATYTTSDGREKVENYYKTKIGPEAVVAEAVDGSTIYRVVKSKTNIGPFVNVWVEQKTTYFTVIKPVK